MSGQHFSGGTIAAILAFCSARYGWGISDTEAGFIAGGAGAVGAGFVHIVTGPGIVPALKRALFGQPESPADPSSA